MSDFYVTLIDKVVLDLQTALKNGQINNEQLNVALQRGEITLHQYIQIINYEKPI
jgi:hypothetical protein